MKEKPFMYDWASFYRAAYEKEKKNNMLLAGKIADAEAKEADLSFRLDRIQGSIFWKMAAPARKCYHVLKDKKPRTGRHAVDTVKAEEAVNAYREEIFRQKHPYLQWISEQEDVDINNKRYNNVRNDCGTWVEGWQRIDLKDTDLCILICGEGFLDSRAEDKIKSWFDFNKNCLFAYTDEDYYWESLPNRMHPWLKPCWSPDTMLSFCYVGHMIITKRSLLNEASEQSGLKNDNRVRFYDLCLRLEEEAARIEGETSLKEDSAKGRIPRISIGHIEEVLFHNRYVPDEGGMRRIDKARRLGKDVLETVEELLQEELEQGFGMDGCGPDFLSVREEALKRRGIRAHLKSGSDPDIYHVIYEIEDTNLKTGEGGTGKEPLVSVIIPSKDHPEILEKCLSSFQKKTEYTNYEWIVVDNGSNLENKKRMEDLQKAYGFAYLYEPMEFNFSAMCNLGARRASGDFLLLLNDDIEIIQKDWLRIMVGQASLEYVGAVGAKLWYAGSDTIQHAGITNLRVGPSHKLTTLPDDRNYYYGRNLVTYDMIGVTAACLLIRKQKYLDLGGMDESMKVAYNDVEFCFRLWKAGYYNVLRNDAVLYHDESLSRGSDEKETDRWMRLLCEKEALYVKHPELEGVDAFYHKHLTGDELNYTCNYKAAWADSREITAFSTESVKESAKAKRGLLKLTIDSVGIQRKLSLSEPDMITVSGWSYLPGENNAEYRRIILLKREDGTLRQAEPFPCLRRDVEEALTEEVNISLAGFVLRFLKKSLAAGSWQIGMLAIHQKNHQSYLTWSDARIEIEQDM